MGEAGPLALAALATISSALVKLEVTPLVLSLYTNPSSGQTRGDPPRPVPIY